LPSDDKTSWNSTRNIKRLIDERPMFTTTTWRAPDPGNPERTLHWSSGIWIDLDASEIEIAVAALNQTRTKLDELGIPPECCNLFATGSKGFHVYIPMVAITPGRASIETLRIFPRLCKEFVARELMTEQTDMSLYCSGQGHLIRQANVLRSNGAFKVPVSWSAAAKVDSTSYKALCSAPRPWVDPTPATTSLRAATAWSEIASKAPKPITRKAPNRDPEAERGKVVSCLRKIDPASLDYADWLRVGCALKSWGAHDALELWEIFSKLDRKRYDPRACAARWEGLSVGSVGIGTLAMLAKGATK
jgi:hypothetical protein